jgi:hypothetical protein
MYDTQHQRGNRLISQEEYWEAIHALRCHDQLEPQPLFGRHYLPYSSAVENAFVVGIPGSGKTTLIDMLMASVLNGCIAPGNSHRAIIHDHKGESIPLMYALGFSFENGLLKTLNAFDQRGVRWDISKDITNIILAQEMARELIPEVPNDSDPFWRNTVRDILAGIFYGWIVKAPGAWRFIDVIETALCPSLNGLLRVLAWSNFNQPIISLLSTAEDRMLKSFLAVLRTAMNPFLPIAILWEKASTSISVKEFLKGSSVLLLGSYPLAEFAMETINRMFLSRLIVEILTDDINPSNAWDVNRNDAENSNRTWFILDEGTKLRRIERLLDLLDLGRQRGVAVVFTFHDIKQLEEVYGNLTFSILSKFGNKAFLRLGDEETANWASGCFGDEEIMIHRLTTNSSDSNRTYHGRNTSPFKHLSEGISRETDIRLSRLVIPSELLSLPKVNRLSNTGINGFFITCGGAVKSHIDWDFIDKRRPQPCSGVRSKMFHDLTALEPPDFFTETSSASLPSS